MYKLNSEAKIHYDYLGGFVLIDGRIVEINTDTSTLLKNIGKIPNNINNNNIKIILNKLIELNIIRTI